MRVEIRAKVLLYHLAGKNGLLARQIARRQGIEKDETTEALKGHFKNTALTIIVLDRWNRRKRVA